ncbi:integrase, catalytic region, zinc finger, CCHC-type containing protein [Tanacetum coccineum]
MKRPRESNASSSSTTQNIPSLSRPLDHMVDENNDESFYSNSSSPSQQVSSSSNVASRVRQNPSHESHDLNTFLSETITLQTQQQNAHRDGLRSIGQALKNMMGGKRKVLAVNMLFLIADQSTIYDISTDVDTVYSSKSGNGLEFFKVEKQKNELLKEELKKSSSDLKDIQANLLKRIQILENDFKRSQAQSLESSNSVRRPKSKDTKLKNRVLTNTNDKNSSAYVRKMSVSVDVFLLSHEKCGARYALSKNSSVKRALFTTPVVVKSKNLGATSVVAKSILSIAKTPTATNKVIQLVLWIVDNGCSMHMTDNLQLLRNFVEKFMGTVHFGNDHFAAITRYGDYVQGNLTICHVYYVEGLGHNLFLVGQFCDGDLEVAFRSNMYYVQNLEGDDLLIGSRDSNLYTIFISEMAASSLVCLMSRATLTKSWLWHRIAHKTSITHTPQQNGVVKRKNCTLFEAARAMRIFSKTLKFPWVEAIATACFTQNRSIVYTQHNKTPYELIRGRKPNIQYFHVFGSLCYPTNDHDDLGKMKPKANIEYCATSSPKMLDNSVANTLNNKNTSSSSSIIVEEDKAPQIVSSSAEQVATEPNSLVLNENADELVQEDVVEFDGNVFYNPPQTHVFEESESSSTF